MVFIVIVIVPVIRDSGHGQNVKPKMSNLSSTRLMGLWKTLLQQKHSLKFRD